MAGRRKQDSTAPMVVYVRTLTPAEIEAIDAIVKARNAASPGTLTSRDRVVAEWAREGIARESARLGAVYAGER